MILAGVISLTALLLVASGAPAAEVKEVLAIVLPPLVAIAAGAGGRRT